MEPSSHYRRVEPSVNEMIQFEVTLKNFGELPASDVTAKFTFDIKKVNKSDVKSNPKNTFHLGPMLPNMEKRYWFFLEPDLWNDVYARRENLFTGIGILF